eukprot:982614-Ditylum_brightwellii.AAC.1
MGCLLGTHGMPTHSTGQVSRYKTSGHRRGFLADVCQAGAEEGGGPGKKSLCESTAMHWSGS